MADVLAWLRALFCRHDFAPLVTTYSPPYDGYISVCMGPQHTERLSLGCTTVLCRCNACGRAEVFVMLGERQSPPSQGKLIPLRKEKVF